MIADAETANVWALDRKVRDHASATRASETSSMPGSSRMPSSSRLQNAILLASTVIANGRVSLKVALACRASHRSSPRSRATASAFVRPAIASISVSIIGIDAVMPVVVTTLPSATIRRSATYLIVGLRSSISPR